MENLSFGHILTALLLTTGGTIGGWALTGKLAGDDAALSFMQVGSIAMFIIFCAQVIFFKLGKSRLIYRVVFNVAFAFGVVWFILCLLLPFLWVPSVGFIEKSTIFLILLVLSIANVFKAHMQFEVKWKDEGEKAIVRHYSSKDNTIDWPKVLAPMRFSLALHIPGIPEGMNPWISLAMIVSMMSGLSLRNVFPVFSLYAWGIPSCLVISIFAQVIGLGLAQIMKLVTLEKRFGKPLGPRN